MFWKRICHIAVLCLVALGVAADEPEVRYFDDWVDVNGIAEGRGPLTEEQARKIFISVRLTSQDGKLREVALVYWGQGIVPAKNYPDSPSIIRYYYDPKGRLDYVDYLDQTETVLLRFDYDETARFADLKRVSTQGKTRAAYLASFISDDDAGYFNLARLDDVGYGRISRMEFIRTPEGFVRQERFLNAAGRPETDADLIAGVDFELLPDGNISRMTYVGTDGKKLNNRFGVAEQRFTYDAAGRILTLGMFDANGQTACNADKIHSYHYSHDGDGNLTEVRFFDRESKAARSKDGIAGWRNEFDSKKRLYRLGFFDENGKPTIDQEIGSAFLSSQYNEHGDVILEEYFDTDGKPIQPEASGYSSCAISFDAKRRPVEFRAFDIDGKPIAGEDMPPILRIRYAPGETTNDYLDAQGAAMLLNGSARSRDRINSWGEVTLTEFIDAAGKLVSGGDMAGSVRMRYDRAGNLTDMVYYQADGKPDSRLKIERDKHGQETGRVWFDGEGNRL